MRLVISDLDGEISIGTAQFPDRKRVALTVGDGNEETVIAYLQSKEAEVLFDEFITRLATDHDRMKRRR